MRPVALWFLATAAAVAVQAAADVGPRREAPTINVGGIVNAASNRPAPDNFISPGAIISIYGTGLAPSTATAATAPLPIELAGVSVDFEGLHMPLFYVSALQINAQAPTNVPPGIWEVRVMLNNLSSSEKVLVRPYSPGLFGVARHVDGTLVSREAPARPGEYILFYGTGFGTNTFPPIPAGMLAPFAPVPLRDAVEARIGDIPLLPQDIYYAGLAPGFAGLYQFNLRIPPAAPSGNLEVLVKVDEYWSQSGMRIAVER